MIDRLLREELRNAMLTNMRIHKQISQAITYAKHKQITKQITSFPARFG